MATPEPAATPAEHDLTGTIIGRFRVLRRVGAGGMGEVYAAEDTTLKRTVALKRLAPRLRSDPQQIHRMIREAQRASSLTHPNIGGVYDVLQERGEVFLVLEYVEGVSLRERMRKRCPRRELLDAVIQCADALARAHAAGVVHGDVKPENIMVGPGGEVKLLDFGVARRMAPGPEFTTETFVSLGGTAGYAAPEVLTEQESDGRSDLFSLGVILYEGFSGTHPFLTQSAVLTLDRTLHRDPPPLAPGADVPEALPAIVQRLLAKEPAERYPSAVELVHDLRVCREGVASSAVVTPAVATKALTRRRLAPSRGAVIAGVAGVMLVLAAMAIWWSRTASSAPAMALPASKFLAVLPFHPAASTSDEQAFAAGVSDAVTQGLVRATQSTDVRIAPYPDVLTYHVTDAAQARKVLGATLAIEGVLHRNANLVQLNYALVDASNGRVYFADQVSAPTDSPTLLQQRLVDALTHTLRVSGRPPQRAVTAAVSPAYEDYMRGQGYSQVGGLQSAESAIVAYSSALARDPNFGAAYAGLGMAYLRKFAASNDPALLTAASDHCSQAIKLAPGAADSHVCLASVDLQQGHYEGAAAELERAVQIDPANDYAYGQLGDAYRRLGRMDDAERSYIRGTQVRPDYWASHSMLGNFYVRIGRYRQAVEQFREAVRLAPDLADPSRQLGGALLYAGEYEDAIAALKSGLAVTPNYQAYSNLGTAYLSLHRFDDAVASFEQAYRMSPTDFISVGNLARAYYWAGKRNEAREKFAEAIRLANVALRVNPRNGDALLLLSFFYAMQGERDNALRTLASARRLGADNPELWYFTAIVQNQLGLRSEAMQSLNQAAALGYSRSEIRTAPELDSLHNLAEFQVLIRAQ